MQLIPLEIIHSSRRDSIRKARELHLIDKAMTPETNGTDVMNRNLCIYFITVLERFSNECRKTKTKAITLTNHNRNKTQNEPIRNQIKYKQLALSARKRVRASHDWY